MDREEGIVEAASENQEGDPKRGPLIDWDAECEEEKDAILEAASEKKPKRGRPSILEKVDLALITRYFGLKAETTRAHGQPLRDASHVCALGGGGVPQHAGWHPCPFCVASWGLHL